MNDSIQIPNYYNFSINVSQDIDIISFQIIYNYCRKLPYGNPFQQKVMEEFKRIVDNTYLDKINDYFKSHVSVSNEDFITYLFICNKPFTDTLIPYYRDKYNIIVNRCKGLELLIDEFKNKYYGKLKYYFDENPSISQFHIVEMKNFLKMFRNFTKIYDVENIHVVLNTMDSENKASKVILKNDLYDIYGKKVLTEYSPYSLIYKYMMPLIKRCTDFSKYVSYFLKDKSNYVIRNNYPNIMDYIIEAYVRCVETCLRVLTKTGSLDYIINKYDALLLDPYLVPFSVCEVFLKAIVYYNTQVSNLRLFTVQFFNISGTVSEDGALNLQWNIDGGAYNIHDPKNNSSQDYEGNFYDPTEKVNNESGFMDVTISQPEYSINFKDSNDHYLSDYDFQPKESPTIPEKHYKFIKENFDFLD